MMFKDLSMIIAAGGAGRRFSVKENKLLAEYAGEPLFLHSLRTFLPLLPAGNLVVAAPEEYIDLMRETADKALGANDIVWCVGGSTRVASTWKAFQCVPEDVKFVAIHDAARPLATGKLLSELYAAAAEVGGAIPGAVPADTIKVVDENGLIVQNLIRKDLAAVATPQVFDYKQYKIALLRLDPAILSGQAEDPQLTDDGAIFMQAGFQVKVVYSDEPNLKVTFANDINYLTSK